MNMYRVIERKDNLKIGIKESTFNTSYMRDKLIKDPDFNTFNRIVNYENDMNLLLNSFSRMLVNLNEGQINNIRFSILDRIKYFHNPRYIKSLLEDFQSKNNLDMTSLINEADTMISADRILSNETRLDNRFNINKFIKEYNTYSEESKISLVEELCFMIDSFNCDSSIKYNTALENVSYALYNHKILLDEEIIVETISRYFEIAGLNIETVLENSTVINEKIKMKVLNKFKTKSVSKARQLISKIKNIETPEQVKKVIRVMYTQSADQIIDDIPNFLTWIRSFLIFSTVSINLYLGCIFILVDQFISTTVKRSEAEKVVTKFKNEKAKCEKKLDKLSNKQSRENLKKYIITLDKSIEKLEEYRDSLMPEERSYDDMEENCKINKEYMDILYEGEYGYTPYTMTPECFYENYKTDFQHQLYQIKNNFESFSIPKIVKETVKYKYNDDYNNILDYLTENGNIYYPILTIDKNISALHHKSLLENSVKGLDSYYKIIEENTCDEYSTIYILTEYAIKREQENIHKSVVETMVKLQESEKAMTNILENISIEDLFDDEVDKFYSDYVKDVAILTTKLESVNNNDVRELIQESKEKLYSREKRPYTLIDTHNDALNILNTKSQIDSLEDLLDVNECFNNMVELKQLITEGGLKNSIVLAREKLKKSVVKLSDKDKEYSRRIDNYLGNLINKTQKNLTNKNREAVIKGSILPSASAILKLALASGVSAFINPVLSAIVLLGGLGAAKIGTLKEKQYILDEIDIELKLVDKKIQLAERNDDTKALEQLYKIEKQLNREKSRIEYNKKNFRPIDR